MQYVENLLKNEKERNEFVLNHLKEQVNKGVYKTRDELEQTLNMIESYTKSLEEINTAISILFKEDVK